MPIPVNCILTVVPNARRGQTISSRYDLKALLIELQEKKCNSCFFHLKIRAIFAAALMAEVQARLRVLVSLFYTL